MLSRKSDMISRRKFLGLGLLALPAAAGIDAKWIEPSLSACEESSICIRGRSLRASFTSLIFITKAMRDLRRMSCKRSMSLRRTLFVSPAIWSKIAPSSTKRLVSLGKLSAGLRHPGQSRLLEQAPFAEYRVGFCTQPAARGCRRAMSTLPKHDLELVGMGITGMDMAQARQASRRILLMHYPAVADQLGNRAFRSDSRGPFAWRTGATAVLPARSASAGGGKLRSRSLSKRRPDRCTLMPGSEPTLFRGVSIAAELRCRDLISQRHVHNGRNAREC